jgi:hypothetical protein
LGAVELVRESELSTGALAAAIERAAACEPAMVSIDSGGAAHSARLITAMIGAAKRPVALKEDFAAIGGVLLPND